MSEKKKGLGRGLSALFGDDDVTAPLASPQLPSGAAQRTVPLAQLEPCPFQPRRNFESQALNELAESLKKHGVLQPLLVRPLSEKPGHYQIVAGERRWRAAQRAKLHELPVVIRDLSDKAVLEIALIENLQRENLQPLEEAETYKKLVEEHEYTQEELAEIIGKSRAHIANMMRLLALPNGVKAMLMTGKLTAGHARALVPLDNPQALAERVVKEGLSVRATEELAAGAESKKPSVKKTAAQKVQPNISALEDKMTKLLGVKTVIKSKPNGTGSLELHYASLDQFDELLRRLGQ